MRLYVVFCCNCSELWLRGPLKCHFRHGAACSRLIPEYVRGKLMALDALSRKMRAIHKLLNFGEHN